MCTRSVLLVLLLLGCLQSFTTANNAKGPAICCLSFFKHRIPVGLITDYKETDLRCSQSGIIFILRNDKRWCADPNKEWVKQTVDKIDQRLMENQAKLLPITNQPPKT